MSRDLKIWWIGIALAGACNNDAEKRAAEAEAKAAQLKAEVAEAQLKAAKLEAELQAHKAEEAESEAAKARADADKLADQTARRQQAEILHDQDWRIDGSYRLDFTLNLPSCVRVEMRRVSHADKGIDLIVTDGANLMACLGRVTGSCPTVAEFNGPQVTEFDRTGFLKSGLWELIGFNKYNDIMSATVHVRVTATPALDASECAAPKQR